MPMTLYCFDGSPAVRATYLCLEALGLNPERKTINIAKGEQHAPEYLKVNPQHSVPTLVDDGFILWDSHAINAYLVNQYGKDDTLYPKDPKKRAIVDHRVHFDNGTLFPRVANSVVTVIMQKNKNIPDELRQKIKEAYDLLEKFLIGHDYIAGDHYTIADFSCVASVATLADGLRFSVEGHPKVKSWLLRCKANLPGYSEAQNSGIGLIKSLADAVFDG